ncbi:hypothetical protein BO78DRAFT_131623 [Aspergillus sclerotiicarbonarius CBS 121057]|uniref:Transmembrane protein n=1 Tax=Aspergillus sclerotiicarbonarius (strain CBS 121057 / IBT 28362) TaxID=1448318 RepID=A0A319ELV2_ASPSB|nr:hypothetical protein BO78DRAFT_131623 [Aspergillus sclerotiicarbonarius CBS 121057]
MGGRTDISSRIWRGEGSDMFLKQCVRVMVMRVELDNGEAVMSFSPFLFLLYLFFFRRVYYRRSRCGKAGSDHVLQLLFQILTHSRAVCAIASSGIVSCFFWGFVHRQYLLPV